MAGDVKHSEHLLRIYYSYTDYPPLFFFFFLMIRPPPNSTLFPYPPLFRSGTPSIDVQRTDKSGAVLGPPPAKLSLVQGTDAAPGGPRIVERYVASTDVVIVPAGAYTAYV